MHTYCLRHVDEWQARIYWMVLAMSIVYREYQEQGHQLALKFASENRNNPLARLLIAAPTGTGKSYLLLRLRDAIANSIIITPSIDVIIGFLEKLNETIPLGDEAIFALAWSHRITTPLRLRNMMIAGKCDVTPDLILLDEVHHDLAASWQDLHTLCQCPAVGVTATPYRGTPIGTAQLRREWGEPRWLISEKDAMDQRHIARPIMETWPLVDDDLISVSNGELVASQVTAATRDKLDHLLELSRPLFEESGKPKRATVFSFPDGKTAEEFFQKADTLGLCVCMIRQDTPRIIRQVALERAANGSHALVNVRVVGEGVDTPFRVYVDASPTLSPVLWRQRLGRCMRPTEDGEEPPRYICTNNNLMRHFYLLDGAMPTGYLAASIAAFNKFTERAGSRAFGLESLGKLRPTEVQLVNGLRVHCYAVTQMIENRQQQFFVIVHPAVTRPVWARRVNTRNGEEMAYTKWELCDAPSELAGFKSVSAGAISIKQAQWWERANGGAKAFGIATQQPNNKQFQILPVLANIGVKLA